MVPAEIPAEIHRSLLQPNRVHAVSPLPQGMSGARVFRCDGDQTLVLRCWPGSVKARRVREIHRVIAPTGSACDLIPEFKTDSANGETFVVDQAGAIWELMTWVPGSPLESDATISSIESGAAAIGQVHRQLEKFGFVSRPAPAIAERIERIAWLNERLPGCLQVNLDGRVHPSVSLPLSLAAERLKAKWVKTAHRFQAQLAPLGRQEVPLQYVLRDVHREHVLFSGEKVNGIIDFDALRIDSAAVDLARWVASFQAYQRNPDQTIRRVVAGYQSRETLPGGPAGKTGGREIDRVDGSATLSDFRTLIRTIADSSAWISLANWVIWLVDEKKQFPDFQRVARRVSWLVEAVDWQTND